jgi:alkanesulfonate monooxygenase SsuD/methylene tetrahydromethanopterin reductase-like flavin-dependent oxidoreductase (luciferase family)
VTRRVRIRIAAVVLPLHNPIEVAEQTVVLDQLSRGRAEVVVALGYVPSEFAMYGRPFRARAQLMDEGLAALSAALLGQSVPEGGSAPMVTPAPVQKPRPRLIVAGGVAASAARAARYADGFYPLRADAELSSAYLEKCRALSVEPGPIIDTGGPMIVHVGDDIDAAWESAGPHLLHEVNAYGAWAAEDSAMDSPYQPLDSVHAVRKSRMYGVVTPDGCLRIMASTARRGRSLVLHPLISGIDPEFAWAGLRRFFDEVLPDFQGRCRQYSMHYQS